MVECSKQSESLFDKVLLKFVSAKRISASVAEKAKLQFSSFHATVVKTNRDAFMAFDKSTDHLDSFLCQFVIGSKFEDLAIVFKKILILYLR